MTTHNGLMVLTLMFYLSGVRRCSEKVNQRVALVLLMHVDSSTQLLSNCCGLVFFFQLHWLMEYTSKICQPWKRSQEMWSL